MQILGVYQPSQGSALAWEFPRQFGEGAAHGRIGPEGEEEAQVGRRGVAGRGAIPRNGWVFPTCRVRRALESGPGAGNPDSRAEARTP